MIRISRCLLRILDKLWWFKFAVNSEKILLKPIQLLKDVDEIKKVVKVYAIKKKAFKLDRVKNEKSRLTLNCAARGCT